MDRGRAALVLLLLFVACTGAAVVVSGSRPGLQQGTAPTVVQVLGYVAALVAGLLLLRPARGLAATVLGGLVVLLVAEMVSRGGTDIGAGGVRLLGMIVIAIATVRLARGGAAARQAP